MWDRRPTDRRHKRRDSAPHRDGDGRRSLLVLAASPARTARTHGAEVHASLTLHKLKRAASATSKAADDRMPKHGTTATTTTSPYLSPKGPPHHPALTRTASHSNQACREAPFRKRPKQHLRASYLLYLLRLLHSPPQHARRITRRAASSLRLIPTTTSDLGLATCTSAPPHLVADASGPASSPASSPASLRSSA